MKSQTKLKLAVFLSLCITIIAKTTPAFGYSLSQWRANASVDQALTNCAGTSDYMNKTGSWPCNSRGIAWINDSYAFNLSETIDLTNASGNKTIYVHGALFDSHNGYDYDAKGYKTRILTTGTVGGMDLTSSTTYDWSALRSYLNDELPASNSYLYPCITSGGIRKLNSYILDRGSTAGSTEGLGLPGSQTGYRVFSKNPNYLTPISGNLDVECAKQDAQANGTSLGNGRYQRVLYVFRCYTETAQCGASPSYITLALPTSQTLIIGKNDAQSQVFENSSSSPAKATASTYSGPIGNCTSEMLGDYGSFVGKCSYAEANITGSASSSTFAPAFEHKILSQTINRTTRNAMLQYNIYRKEGNGSWQSLGLQEGFGRIGSLFTTPGSTWLNTTGKHAVSTTSNRVCEMLLVQWAAYAASCTNYCSEPSPENGGYEVASIVCANLEAPLTTVNVTSSTTGSPNVSGNGDITRASSNYPSNGIETAADIKKVTLPETTSIISPSFSHKLTAQATDGSSVNLQNVLYSITRAVTGGSSENAGSGYINLATGNTGATINSTKNGTRISIGPGQTIRVCEHLTYTGTSYTGSNNNFTGNGVWGNSLACVEYYRPALDPPAEKTYNTISQSKVSSVSGSPTSATASSDGTNEAAIAISTRDNSFSDLAFHHRYYLAFVTPTITKTLQHKVEEQLDGGSWTDISNGWRSSATLQSAGDLAGTEYSSYKSYLSSPITLEDGQTRKVCQKITVKPGTFKGIPQANGSLSGETTITLEVSSIACANITNTNTPQNLETNFNYTTFSEVHKQAQEVPSLTRSSSQYPTNDYPTENDILDLGTLYGSERIQFSHTVYSNYLSGPIRDFPFPAASYTIEQRKIINNTDDSGWVNIDTSSYSQIPLTAGRYGSVRHTLPYDSDAPQNGSIAIVCQRIIHHPQTLVVQTNNDYRNGNDQVVSMVCVKFKQEPAQPTTSQAKLPTESKVIAENFNQLTSTSDYYSATPNSNNTLRGITTRTDTSASYVTYSPSFVHKINLESISGNFNGALGNISYTIERSENGGSSYSQVGGGSISLNMNGESGLLISDDSLEYTVNVPAGETITVCERITVNPGTVSIDNANTSSVTAISPYTRSSNACIEITNPSPNKRRQSAVTKSTVLLYKKVNGEAARDTFNRPATFEASVTSDEGNGTKTINYNTESNEDYWVRFVEFAKFGNGAINKTEAFSHEGGVSIDGGASWPTTIPGYGGLNLLANSDRNNSTTQAPCSLTGSSNYTNLNSDGNFYCIRDDFFINYQLDQGSTDTLCGRLILKPDYYDYLVSNGSSAGRGDDKVSSQICVTLSKAASKEEKISATTKLIADNTSYTSTPAEFSYSTEGTRDYTFSHKFTRTGATNLTTSYTKHQKTIIENPDGTINSTQNQSLPITLTVSDNTPLVTSSGTATLEPGAKVTICEYVTFTSQTFTIESTGDITPTYDTGQTQEICAKFGRPGSQMIDDGTVLLTSVSTATINGTPGVDYSYNSASNTYDIYTNNAQVEYSHQVSRGNFYHTDDARTPAADSAYQYLLGANNPSITQLSSSTNISSLSNGQTNTHTSTKNVSSLNVGQTQQLCEPIHFLSSSYTMRARYYMLGGQKIPGQNFIINNEHSLVSNNLIGTSQACISLYRPYNFEIESIAASQTSTSAENGIVYQGGILSASFDVKVKKHQENQLLTSIPNATYQTFTFTLSGDSTVPGALAGGTTNDPCTFFNKNGFTVSNCVPTETSQSIGKNGATTASTYYPNDSQYSANFTRSAVASSSSVGSRFCIAMAIKPTDSGNGHENGFNNLWTVSAPVCTAVGKKPMFQVWGGSVQTNGGINTSLTGSYEVQTTQEQETYYEEEEVTTCVPTSSPRPIEAVIVMDKDDQTSHPAAVNAAKQIASSILRSGGKVSIMSYCEAFNKITTECSSSTCAENNVDSHIEAHLDASTHDTWQPFGQDKILENLNSSNIPEQDQYIIILETTASPESSLHGTIRSFASDNPNRNFHIYSDVSIQSFDIPNLSAYNSATIDQLTNQFANLGTSQCEYVTETRSVPKTRTITKYNTVLKGLYGSWGDFALIGGSDKNGRSSIASMASGAAIAQGVPSSTNIMCGISPLTITNTECQRGNQTKLNQAGSNISRGSDIITKVRARYPSTDTTSEHFKVIKLTNQDSNGNYTLSLSNFANANVTVDPGIYASVPIIVYPGSDGGSITITENIEIAQNRAYSNSRVPFIIIVSDGNINVSENVSRIDAWLLANGTFNSCTTPNGTPYTNSNLSANTCANQLYVSGPVVAESLYLRRTFGAEVFNATPQPAEIFNYSPSIILSSYSEATSVNQPITTYIRKIAPRY